MAWVHQNREITKEEYDEIMEKKRTLESFFSTGELIGYGAIPHYPPYEKDGKYYIGYGISTSCD